MNKRRVLVMGEAHYLSSGFGTYSKELLTRLHNTNKYELAEFAAYGRSDLGSNVPWTFYPNMPDDNNSQETELYNSNGAHQFGLWRFDKVCLDFCPDIVLCYRDPWMDNWIQESPSRPYFHWVWMPTVDSAPQRQEWINTFTNCDAVFSYSEFGGKVLQEQGKERLNFKGCASPGIDPAVYKPLPKRELRQEMGLDPDCFIVGTVMRNQKRKLFFELMKSFRLFLDRAPTEIASKTFLYLHTSYPEKMGWDIPDGILQNKLGGKVLMTYVCKTCKKFFPSVFNDALHKCKFCHNISSVCPTVSHGVSIAELAQIYNLLDLYVQYAICEGFGMPAVEAAACGVPVAAVDYSAMEDVVRFTKGYPIPVKAFFREIETNAERAHPDNDALADIMLQFFRLTGSERLHKAMEVRAATIKRYSWDDTAKVWENYIDTYTPTETQGKWDAPPRIVNVATEIPSDLSPTPDGFVKWLFNSVQPTPEKVHQYEGAKLCRDLAFGANISQGILEPIDRNQIFTNYQGKMNHKNSFEQLRTNRNTIVRDHFLVEANPEYEQQA